MYINMPVNVISKACEKCPRLRIIVTREYSGDKIYNVEIECANYDECLNALDMYEKGLDKHDDNGTD